MNKKRALKKIQITLIINYKKLYIQVYKKCFQYFCMNVTKIKLYKHIFHIILSIHHLTNIKISFRKRNFSFNISNIRDENSTIPRVFNKRRFKNIMIFYEI